MDINNGFGIVFLIGTAYINKTTTYNLPIACNTLVPMITAHNLGVQSRYAEIKQTTISLVMALNSGNSTSAKTYVYLICYF